MRDGNEDHRARHRDANGDTVGHGAPQTRTLAGVADAPLTPAAPPAAAVSDVSSGASRPLRQQKPKKQQPKKQQQRGHAEPTPAPVELTDLFDFDCNLTHDDLVNDVDALMERAAAAGVTEMLVPGATLAESHAAIALCRQHPTRLFPTAGVHPYHALAAPTPEELADLAALARLDACRAVGECGLDYSPSFPAPAHQRAWFDAQLELACALEKPLFLHERAAHDDFVAAIASCAARHNGYFPPAVVHCFTGSERELRAYVAQGFYIGVTGFICKQTHGAALRALVQLVPLQRLVIETDAPYMGFPKCRRREPLDAKKQYPNVPSALPLVAEVVAAALGKTPQEIATITRANARRFLRLSV